MLLAQNQDPPYNFRNHLRGESSQRGKKITANSVRTGAPLSLHLRALHGTVNFPVQQAHLPRTFRILCSPGTPVAARHDREHGSVFYTYIIGGSERDRSCHDWQDRTQNIDHGIHDRSWRRVVRICARSLVFVFIVGTSSFSIFPSRIVRIIALEFYT